MIALMGVIAVLLIVAEIGLRVTIGFGLPLIYQADPSIGYLLAPNQKTRRFGNLIEINQYSMRSAAISPTCDRHIWRILLLGDSIANGGWWTDQSQIMSALMRQTLQQNQNKAVEVLNASANSWCPRNQVEYVKRFGLFEAQAVVLLINTDDLFGTAPTSVPVGRDRFYPDHQPPLALVEAFQRILPYKPPAAMAEVNAEGGDRVGYNLTAIQTLQQLATENQAQLLLAMTPLLRELGGKSRDYELTARNRLTEFIQTQNITYIDFLPIFDSIPEPETLYRDHIHLSASGDQKVAQMICQTLLDTLKNS